MVPNFYRVSSVLTGDLREKEDQQVNVGHSRGDDLQHEEDFGRQVNAGRRGKRLGACRLFTPRRKYQTAATTNAKAEVINSPGTFWLAPSPVLNTHMRTWS